jgi:hypothetical protein
MGITYRAWRISLLDNGVSPLDEQGVSPSARMPADPVATAHDAEPQPLV